ncbi:9518_t:CDS:1, partial [Paraglomus occultum]
FQERVLLNNVDSELRGDDESNAEENKEDNMLKLERAGYLIRLYPSLTSSSIFLSI